MKRPEELHSRASLKCTEASVVRGFPLKLSLVPLWRGRVGHDIGPFTPLMIRGRLRSPGQHGALPRSGQRSIGQLSPLAEKIISSNYTKAVVRNLKVAGVVERMLHPSLLLNKG